MLRSINLLFSNAGTALAKRVEDLTTADWRAMMALNLDSAFFAAEAALAHLTRSQGSTVHIAFPWSG